MALYVGETVRVISRIKDYNGGAVDDGSDVTVTVDIYDSTETLVVEAAEMSWDATGNADGPYWYYEWDTEGVPAGKYDTKATCVGNTNNLKSFDFGTVKLAAPKVGA